MKVTDHGPETHAAAPNALLRPLSPPCLRKKIALSAGSYVHLRADGWPRPLPLVKKRRRCLMRSAPQAPRTIRTSTMKPLKTRATCLLLRCTLPAPPRQRFGSRHSRSTCSIQVRPAPPRPAPPAPLPRPSPARAALGTKQQTDWRVLAHVAGFLRVATVHHGWLAWQGASTWPLAAAVFTRRSSQP